MENFVDQGFAASSAAKGAESAIAHARGSAATAEAMANMRTGASAHAPHTHIPASGSSSTHAPHKPSAQKPSETQRQLVGGAEMGIAQLNKRVKPTAEDRTISVLEGVKSAGNYAWTIGWLPIPGLGGMALPVPAAIAWVASKCGARGRNIASAIKMPIEAARHSIENLTVSSIGALPADMLKNASEYARTAEGAGIQRAAAPLARAAESTGKFMASVSKGMGEVFSPLATGAKNMATHLNKTDAGSRVVGMMGKAAKIAGKTPLSVAMIATAASAATVATFMTTNRERKQANTLIAELKTELGADHPFVQEASLKAANRSRMGWVGAGMTSAGELVGVKLAGGGLDIGKMMPAVAAQMGLGSLAGLVVPGNDFLNACTAVKHAAEMPVDQLIPAYTLLLTAKDSVRNNGMEYNQLARAMGKKLAANKASFAEVANLVKDDKAFTAFATEVEAEQKAAKAAQVAALKDQPPVDTGKAHVSPVAAETVIAGKAAASNDAPQIKGVSTVGAQHQGTLHTQQQRVSGF